MSWETKELKTYSSNLAGLSNAIDNTLTVVATELFESIYVSRFIEIEKRSYVPHDRVWQGRLHAHCSDWGEQ